MPAQEVLTHTDYFFSVSHYPTNQFNIVNITKAKAMPENRATGKKRNFREKTNLDTLQSGDWANTGGF